jgi:hypothetical protein
MRLTNWQYNTPSNFNQQPDISTLQQAITKLYKKDKGSMPIVRQLLLVFFKNVNFPSAILSNSMDPSPAWEAGKEIPHLLYNPEVCYQIH